LDALNYLDVKMADISNAYLTSPITAKVWTVLGPEFGNEAGKRALIMFDLYGFKSSVGAFSNHLAKCMNHLGRKPCCADRNLRMKVETRAESGGMYWAYILIYVDDIMCVHHDHGTPLVKVDGYFKMKEGSIQVPTFYVGTKLKNSVLPNGIVDWGMSSSKYVQSAIQNIQEYLTALLGDKKLLKKDPDIFAGGYKPELDASIELDHVMEKVFQLQTGILR
jgi:hypothetical protein